MARERILIIGAGPTGLGAAHGLESAGFPDWLLFEREDRPGGLARSVKDARGYTWDFGGHVTFSTDPRYLTLLNGLLGPDGWIEHDRESWIRVRDVWVPYPFQNNIHRLAPGDRAACAEGLVRAALERRADPCEHFDEFIVRTFGEGIADLFLRPYNFKVWAYPPAMLDTGWIAERVSVPDPLRVVRNLALGRDDCAWGPNNRFRFPRSGGTGAIWKALAARLPSEKIRLAAEVVGIDVDRRVVTLANGEEHTYAALISSMSLDRLVSLSGRADWQAAARGLVHSSAHIVGVGLSGRPSRDLETKCWMYFPEANCPFYRVTHFSLYSPSNVPDIEMGWSLMCEISESARKPVEAGAAIRDTLAGLEAAGLIADPACVIHTWVSRVEYAYPTPARGRDAILDQLQPQLAREGIHSRGRFGAWRYEIGNMDHSYLQGLEAALHLVAGESEAVFASKRS